MATERNIIKLEKEIKLKMISIKSGVVLPKDSGIGKLLNLLKSIDEVSYDKMLDDYKIIINGLPKR